MVFDDETLKAILDRTSGKCHICHKKLSPSNYGIIGEKGAWEVEHSVPRSRGGTDHMNNLFPACISCNRSKRDGSTRSARAHFDKRRAPLSRAKREQAKADNALGYGILFLALGAFGGPAVAVIAGTIGAAIGYDQNPDES
jgi:5-methylcytosine-specific restriction endonuclease McrA